MSKRKFKIISSFGTNIVFPVNDAELIYKWKKSSEVSFIKSLETILIFRNNIKESIMDFDFFYQFERDRSKRCEEVTCEIYKTCNGIDIIEYKGLILLKTANWDLEQCIVSIKLEQEKGINFCIDNLKKELKTPIATFCPYASANPDIDNSCANVFLYTKIGADFVFLTIKTFIINSLSYSPKVILTGGDSNAVKYPYGQFAVMCYAVVEKLLIACGRDYNLPMIKSDYFDWNAPGDTVGYIASTTPKLPLNLPPSNYPDGIYGYSRRFIYRPDNVGINYVTGGANQLTNLMFMPKSNANNRTASEWEQENIIIDDPSGFYVVENANDISFADLELIWATMFQAYWFIDTDGCMRVEHLSWFQNNAQTYNTLTSENIKLNLANKKYSYVDDELPKKETFLFSANRDYINGNFSSDKNDATTTSNNGNNEIIYSTICVSKENEEKKYLLENVTTDITAMDSKNNSNAKYYDTNGMMLFNCSGGGPFAQQNNGNYEFALIVYDNPTDRLTGSGDITDYPNGHLQWGNLIRNYLRYNRPLSIGKNGKDFITFSPRVIKTKKQVPVYLKWCCSNGEFQPSQANVLTSLGNGDIDEAQFSTKTNIITITSLHD